MKQIKEFKISNNKYEKYSLLELIKKYTPLTKHICSKYYSSIYDYDDMLQEAHIAIIIAFDKYNNKSKVSIGHYLKSCIENAISTYCRTNRSRSIINNSKKYLSLDSEIKADAVKPANNYAFINNIVSEQELLNIENKLCVEQLMIVLNPVEKNVIKDIFVNNMPQRKIASKHNFSQAQISRIKSVSLLKLRKNFM